jgi:general stress protein 26
MDTRNGKTKNGGRSVQEERGSLAELRRLLTEFDTAMLVTVTPEKLLRARPMGIQDPEEMPGCDLWFVTGEDTAKVEEVHEERQVCVCAYRARDRSYVSISAVARTERDPAAVRRLWKPAWRAWFSGPDDPTIVLLKLDVERAEYWEPEGGRARVLFEMIRGIVTGEPADAHLNPPKRV